MGGRIRLKETATILAGTLIGVMLLSSLFIFPRISAYVSGQSAESRNMFVSSNLQFLRRTIENERQSLARIAKTPSFTNAVLLGAVDEKMTDIFNHMSVDRTKARLVLQDIAGSILYRSPRPLTGQYEPDDAWFRQLLSGEHSFHFAILGQNNEAVLTRVSVPVIYGGSVEGILSAEGELTIARLLGLLTAEDLSAVHIKQDGAIASFVLEAAKIPKKITVSLDELELSVDYIFDDQVVVATEEGFEFQINLIVFLSLLVSFFLFTFAGFRSLGDAMSVSDGTVAGLLGRYRLPILTACIGCAATVGAFLFAWHLEQVSHQESLQRIFRQIRTSIEQEIGRSLRKLNSLKAFYDSSSYVDQEDFKLFAAHLLAGDTPVDKVEWGAVVDAELRSDFEQLARTIGIETFFIADRDPETGALVPAPFRRTHYVSFSALSRGDVSQMPGLDHAGLPVHLVAIETARDTGRPAAGAPDSKPSEGKPEVHSVIFQPVFDGAQGYPNAALRREHMNGFVAVHLNLERLIRNALSQADEPFNILVRDTGMPDDAGHLFRVGQSGIGDEQPSEFQFLVSYAGRQLQITGLPARVYQFDQVWLLSILAAGFLLTAVISLFLGQLIRRREIIQAVVDQRTLELREKQQETEQANAALKVAKAKLEHEATHDTLTGLPNRRFLGQILEDIAESRGKALQNVVMAHIDLDRFKEVNDTMGHEAGDHVLVQCARIIQSVLYPGEFAARVGGDEFVVVAKGDVDLRGFTERMHGLITELSMPIDYEGKPCRIGASIGMASDCGANIDASRMLIDADIALYKAKGGGRNACVVFDSKLRSEAEQKKKVADEIIKGLERSEFIPVYEPQFDARTMDVIGVEALARWVHPDRGILTPFAFLDVAEELDVTPRIDEMILQKALEDVHSLSRSGTPLHKVSVNVSSRRLADPTLLGQLPDFHKYPFAVSFELLETIFLDQVNGTIAQNLDGLRQAGVYLEIDDFGTGHASVISVMQVAPYRLKIDRALVAPAVDDPAKAKILKLIIDLGHAMNVSVLAEGIETVEHARLLTKLGCDGFQGYLFSRPLTYNALKTFLSEERWRKIA